MNHSVNKSYADANRDNKSLLQWTQWQLLDSILPTGGFAHSYGLESAMQSNLIKQPEDLKPFIIQVLDNTGSLFLPFVHTLNKSPDTETWTRLDNLLEATLTNEIARKASASQGSALLRVAASVFHEIAELKLIRERFIGSGLVYFHHACVFGLVTGLLGFDGKTAQRSYVYLAMRDVLSAATRLNLVGPIAASGLQHEIASAAEGIVERWMDRAVEDACQTNPLLDTVQGCHGYLFSRLFCS
ncbi:urease accessory protein F isoform X1 [Carex littledalei]|uniref:Urease accessory protein F isoform X1 n=1 Tax=Carex littledalei TaxID=544730 RepID=A0A833QFW6_9POAL|nr:urease accessory protein F isoform X1 [Carex littledalei]